MPTASKPQGKDRATPGPSARERILDTAYDLFSHEGIRAVGVDTIIARSGVAKMTFYRHFPSKDTLVLAFLELREERWTLEWLQGESGKEAEDPGARMLAIFDVFDRWFHSDDFEGCSFINVLLEMNENGQLKRASALGLEHIRAFIRGLATEAGAPDPWRLARQWTMLMKGSIIAAQEGDLDAAKAAQEVAALLLDHELSGAARRAT
jgi:AcrR family transcriptional regulator